MNINVFQTGAWDYNTNSHDGSRYLDIPLANWIVDFLKSNNITNLYDFGCSTGYYLKYISDNTTGMKLTGVEPSVSNRADKFFDNILSYDLAMPFSLENKGTILCLEVLEHIPPQFESVAIDNLVNHCDQYLLMSWATPGQGGYGHFNEKSFEDVKKLLISRGFEFMEQETLDARSIATLYWLQNNFSVFRKTY